jgi:predicted acylesterase/phospholipase RssA
VYAAPKTVMKIGLALSGGGFRATLFHLGLVRFLRDADILRQVTHITSVSGGSIMAAHLALNWNRYTGSTEQFEQAASNLLDFIQLDIRNRILRHFPLGLLLRWPRRVLGLSNRQLTRTGLLERSYEKNLYGDKSLFELSGKRGQNYFFAWPAFLRGRPRGRMVRSRSSRLANRLVQASSPYGSPVALERRIASRTASSIGRCTFSDHFRARTLGMIRQLK